MATTTTPARNRLAAVHVVPPRAQAVAGATLAAMAVWAVAVPILGGHLVVRFGSGAPLTIGLGSVAGATLTASVLGWATLAALERRSPFGRSLWTRIAIAALLVSLALPLSTATTGSTRVALVAMHLSVAAILIPAFRRSSPTLSATTTLV